MKTISITEARAQLLRLAEEIEGDPRTVVAVSKRGKPVLTVLSSEAYESLMETLEILADERLTADLKKALREIEKRQGMPWETVKRRLGLKEK